MAKDQTINEIKKSLIEGYKSADNETDKARIKAELLAVMDDKERATYLSNDVSVIASEIVHMKHTLAALEDKFNLMGDLAIIFGYPVSEKVRSVSGHNTVQINTTIDVVDTESLKRDCQSSVEIAKGVELAIQKKKDKITIDSLCASDLKNLVPSIPKREKVQTKVYVRDV